jgi:hypothetical protein
VREKQTSCGHPKTPGRHQLLLCTAAQMLSIQKRCAKFTQDKHKEVVAAMTTNAASSKKGGLCVCVCCVWRASQRHPYMLSYLFSSCPE